MLHLFFNVYSTIQEILMPRKELTEAAAIDSQVLTIQLPGLEDMDSGKDQRQVDLLKEISKKLTTLVNGVKDIKSSLKDLKEQTVAKTVVPAPDESNGQIGETLEQIRNYLERLSEPQHEPAVIQESTTTGILIEEEALRLKSRISNIWDINQKSRRLAYWQSYRNQNIANKYTEWSELDTVILPQWLQMKAIPNESTNLTKRREKQVLDNLKAEIELLQLRHENQEGKYQGIDEKMKAEISKLATGERRNTLIKLWEEDCKRNELISQKRWEDKNAPWFVKYENSFRKKHENKNPYIKIGDENDGAKTYAEVVANSTQRAPQQRPNNLEGRQEPPTNLRAENVRNQRPTSQRAQQPPRQGLSDKNRGTWTPNAENQGPNRASVPSPPMRNDEILTDSETRRTRNNDQQSFLGLGRGRGRGRGRVRGQSRGRGRSRGRTPRY